MIDRPTIYAERVLEGKVTAGLPHHHACKRHIDDRLREGRKDFPYIWLPEKANRIISFAEMLTIAEGEEPMPVKLQGFQDFDLGVPFGWVRRDNGKRRFRRKYKCVARQNGKTMENGITGTYISNFSGYRYGKLFTVATKKRQARLAWEEIARFIEIDPDLSKLFKVQDYKSLITANGSKCSIEALSKESGLDDGFRSIFASIDELHQHKDNSVYKAIYNGTKNLPETLMSMITTRGKLINSFCHEIDDYALKILSGNATAEDFFADIYTLDKGDKPFDPDVWIKANPWLASTETGMRNIETDAQTAKDMGGSELSDFMTKTLNIWVTETENAYLNHEAWKACGCALTLKDMTGRKCWVGIDLSSGGDLTSIALLFPLDNGMYYVWSHSFMPRGRFEEHILSDLAPYDVWEQTELMTVTGGSSDFKNDYKFILAKLKELAEAYEIGFLGIGIDPHNADALLSDLEDFGAPVMVIKQSAKELNDGTVDFQLQVKSKKVAYDIANELLTWSMLSAKTVYNSFKEMKIDKEPGASCRRIDPADAVIDAVVIMLKCREEEPIDHDAVVENWLKQMGS